MKFRPGDIIVHWTHGFGRVVGIEQKVMEGATLAYYVVEVKQLKFWVPVEEADEGSLRFPTERSGFKDLLDILRGPGNHLPDHQYQRKIILRDRMQKSTLGDQCHVIRDLTDRSHEHTLNQNDFSVLFRAEEHLLDEWVFAMNTERPDAMRELDVLLKADQGVPGDR